MKTIFKAVVLTIGAAVTKEITILLIDTVRNAIYQVWYDTCQVCRARVDRGTECRVCGHTNNANCKCRYCNPKEKSHEIDLRTA